MKKMIFILLVFALSSLMADDFKDIEAEKYINLDKECKERQIAKSCMMLGVTLSKTQGYDLDSYFVQSYSKKACDIGGLYSSIGCDQIASTYLIKAYDENITARDYYVYMAKKYYKKSCERRNEANCEMLEIIDNNFKNESYKKEWYQPN